MAPDRDGPPAWDAEVLGRVRHLHVTARVLTDALMMGVHRSRRVGQAIEFADYQEYAPGMDLRALDWKVLGRTDRRVVRRYETETELACTVVVDLSGDLATGAGAGTSLPALEGTKAGFAIRLAATLLYWFHRQGEPVGLTIVGGEGIDHPVLPVRGGRTHLQLAFLQLAKARPGGVADLGTQLADIGRRTRRRSWVGVITDGMEEPATWLPALRAFARRGADLRLVHLFDRAEMQLDVGRAAVFYSPEGGPALPLDPQGAQADFREIVAEYLEEVRRGVITVGGQYVQVATDEPLERVFRRLVHGGSRPVELP